MDQKKKFEALSKDAKITKKLRFASSNRLISTHWYCVIALNLNAAFTIMFSILSQAPSFADTKSLTNVSTAYSILTLALGLIIFSYDYSRRSWELHRNAVKIDFFNRRLEFFIVNSPEASFDQINFDQFNDEYETIINESINHEQIDYYLSDSYKENHPHLAIYYLLKSKTIKIIMILLMISPLIFLYLTQAYTSILK